MNLERWRSLSLKEQIGHITSEIVRASVWEERGDLSSRNGALERALELIDLTLECYSQSRRRELARLREVVAHCLVQSDRYPVTLSDLRC